MHEGEPLGIVLLVRPFAARDPDVDQSGLDLGETASDRPPSIADQSIAHRIILGALTANSLGVRVSAVQSFYRRAMIRIIVGLLVVWLILSVLGFIIKGLFWLAIVGIVLFVITALIGFVRRGVAPRS